MLKFTIVGENDTLEKFSYRTAEELKNEFQNEAETMPQRGAIVVSAELDGKKLKCPREFIDLMAELGIDETQDYRRKRITKTLKKLGVGAETRGFFYLRYAVEFMMDHLSSKEYAIPVSACNVLYPKIAENFHTTVPRIERAIRHCIENAMLMADLDYMDEVFGMSVNPDKDKPGNMLFINTVADYLLL